MRIPSSLKYHQFTSITTAQVEEEKDKGFSLEQRESLLSGLPGFGTISNEHLPQTLFSSVPFTLLSWEIQELERPWRGE